jgi:NAD(P)H dehydrogenase (quinone)
MFAVLGATGNAGGATVRALRERGLPVRAILRDKTKAGELEALGCEIAIADLRDAAALAKAIAGAQAVQAICPIGPQAQDPAADMRAIIDAIGDALVAAKPGRVVAISDYGAERSAGTGITLAFHYLETRLRETPTKLTLLRSSEHMQNWARLFKTAAATGVLPSLHHPLTKIFPMASAQDVGIVAADLLTERDPPSTPRIVYVEGPRRYTALDVAEALAGAFGRKVVARELPRPDWMAALTRGGLSPAYAGLVAELYDAHNAGLIDVEPGATDIRRGATDFADLPMFQPTALAALVGSAAPARAKT